MTLAQVQIGVAFVVTMIATWAGLLMAVALLFPQHAGRAEYSLETEPKKCMLSGLAMIGLFVLAIVLLNVPNPLVKLAGFLLTLAVLGLLVVGSAGLSHLLGRRIAEMSGAKTSFGCLVRGSLLFSLALGFPYVGWFLFAPLTALFTAGAGFLALRRPQVTAPSPAFEQQGV